MLEEKEQIIQGLEKRIEEGRERERGPRGGWWRLRGGLKKGLSGWGKRRVVLVVINVREKR